MPKLRTANGRKIVRLDKMQPEMAKDNVRDFKKAESGQPICPMCKAGARTSKAGFADADMGISRDTRLFSAHAAGGRRLNPGEFPCPGSYRVAE